MSRIAKAAGPLITAATALLLAFVASQSQAQTVATEEFYGPFPSWRQVQCNGEDDTAMLQAELNVLGTPGNSPVLFIQPGTCRLTGTLWLDSAHGGCRYGGVTMLGADPATTRMVWAGPSDVNQPMLSYACIFQSRFGRLTWDGGGIAKSVYGLALRPEFNSGNRHEDEWFVNLHPEAIAVRSGESGIGDAETEWVRTHFIGPMAAGILLKSFNSLDHWVWDSEFRDLHVGVGNAAAPFDSGAGGFAVNRSNFLNNVANMQIANTMFFSSRWNYSRGSGWHVLGHPIGPAAASWTSQGETIIDPKPVGGEVRTAFQMGNVGPLGVVDLTLRSGRHEVGIASVWEGYCAANCGGDLWSIGNRYSSPSISQYSAPAPPYGTGRYAGGMYALDDQPGQTVVDPGPLQLPATPPPSKLPVIEVQNGDIAAALAQAGSERAIVHVPYGEYMVPSTLQVGPNVVLVGDGNSTAGTRIRAGIGVNPVMRVAGPAQTILRDFVVEALQAGSKQADGIVIDNADQPSGLVHIEMLSGLRNRVGVDVSNLSHTIVQGQDGGIGAVQEFDDPGPGVEYRVTNARLRWFMGAGADSDYLYEQRGGELIVQNRFYQGGIHNGRQDLLMAQSDGGTAVLDIGNFAASGGLDTSGHGGSMTLIGISETDNCAGGAPSMRFGSNTLALGVQFGWTGPLPACSAAPTITAGPTLALLMRHSTGGGTDLHNAIDQNAGVRDQAAFVREHLAPMRAAKPLSPGGRPAGITDVRLYRVGVSLTRTGIKVVGNLGSMRSDASPSESEEPTP